MSRFWHYAYKDWHPAWWNYVIPYQGGDQWGRRTLVIPVHPFGFIVWAWKKCYCADCRSMREQTARWEAEESGEGLGIDGDGCGADGEEELGPVAIDGPESGVA